MQERLRALFDVAVAAADPLVALPPYLAAIGDPRPRGGRLVVLGAGKAAAAMAQAVRVHFGPCEGLVITRYGHQGDFALDAPQVVQAGHPLPDAAGVAATQRLLALAQGLGPDDLALVLISGGASALLCAPIAGYDLADKAALSAQLLASGAPIGDINLIRKQFSRVKGGGLARAIAPARLCGLIISDVAGDDLADIGSGPTVADGRDAAAAAAAARWGVTLPQRREQMGGEIDWTRVQNHLVAAPMASLRAAQRRAADWGWQVHILGDDLAGEARILAQAHADLALGLAARMRPFDPPRLILSGGEATVTLDSARADQAQARGGPNAEYALALALALQGHGQIFALAADTDGIDGAGPPAGAIITPQTPLGDAAHLALARHDAHGFFMQSGGAVVTGPTQTNVNDFRALLILPPSG